MRRVDGGRVGRFGAGQPPAIRGMADKPGVTRVTANAPEIWKWLVGSPRPAQGDARKDAQAVRSCHLVNIRRIGLAIGEADMRFWLILATAAIPFFNSYANAQITVYGVPADLAGDVSMSVVTEQGCLVLNGGAAVGG